MPGPESAEIQSAIVPTADLHCHLLPNWDDGPRNLEESLAMARRAAESGLSHIVVTPHVGREFRGVAHPAAEIPPAVSELQASIDEAGIQLKLVSGAEIALGLVDLTGGGFSSAMTVNGALKYALVESPYQTWPDFAGRSLDFLISRGVTPIIAHPERYVDVQKDPKLLEKAIASGVLLQITAGSLVGEQGKEAQACSEKLLRLGWVGCVASDAHRDIHALPADAVESVTRIVGQEVARKIFEEFPLRVVNGKSVSLKSAKPIAAAPPRKSFLGRFIGRGR